MGEKVDASSDRKHLRSFTRHLLRDLEALERLLREERFEKGVRRIGAEQELFLLDRRLRPARAALDLIREIDDSRITPELGLFNLELNLTPRELGGTCFSEMRAEIDDLLAMVRNAGMDRDLSVLLCGIAPTISPRDLEEGAMTPEPRYLELDRVIQEIRGGPARLHIEGADELQLVQDGVMLEACNASFQVHLQVAPEEFALLYNTAQLITAPVLGVSVNSPVLFQRRLWQETRLALFTQAVDDRRGVQHARRIPPRVSFGSRWVEDSILDIYREDITRYRAYLTYETDEDPFEVLEEGRAPRLEALSRFNGTVYRWNRPCYGVSNGEPHLRIEHRVLPSGPSVPDQIASAALFLGLMMELPRELGDPAETVRFDVARDNFRRAAHDGLDATIDWPGLGERTLPNVMEHLLPLARNGLERVGVASDDLDELFGVLEQRVQQRRTGAAWILDSLDHLGDEKRDSRYRDVTRAMVRLAATGAPCHEWPLAEPGPEPILREKLATVEQVMTAELFTLREDDLIDLAASFMDWEHIRHVPVEDSDGRLVGLVSQRQLLRLVGSRGSDEPVAVSEIMRREPVTIGPRDSCLDAIGLMKRHRVSCLPVVEDGRLVGIITERDFIPMTARLLEEHLRSPE